MGLGTITNIEQSVRAMEVPQSTARGTHAAKQSGKIPDDDSAVAVIRNLHRAENSDVGPDAVDGGASTLSEELRQFTASFSESLSRFKELSEKIANGRFSPTTLRDQIERLKESAGMPGSDHPDTVKGQNSALAFLNSDEFKSASRGSTDTRSLAWLKTDARIAFLSQDSVEPDRVLALLREMVNPGTATSRKGQAMYRQEAAHLSTVA